MPPKQQGIVRMSARQLDLRKSYVYGKVLPSVADEHENLHSEQFEYDKRDICSVDFAGLPVHINHKQIIKRVGCVAGYEPLPEKNEARTLLEIGSGSFEQRFAEAAVASAFYPSISLSHHFSTESEVNTSAQTGYHEPSLVTRKQGLEVSLCAVPGRPGAEIVEVCLSRDALMQQSREYLRRLAERYNYPPPPEVPRDPHAVGNVTLQRAANVPLLSMYVDKVLHPASVHRLKTLVDNGNFLHKLTIPALGGAHTATTARTASNGIVSMSNNSSTTAATNTPAGDGMAVDAPPSKAAASETVLTDLEPKPTDTPEEQSRKLLAITEAQMSELAQLRAERAAANAEKAAADKAAREERERLESEKLGAWQVGLQALPVVTAQSLGTTQEEAGEMSKALTLLDDQLAKAGVPLSEREKSLGEYNKVIVCASKRARTAAEESARLKETTADIAARFLRSKNSVGISGGAPVRTPLATPTVQPKSAPTTASTSSSTSSSAARNVPTYFGLTQADMDFARAQSEWQRQNAEQQQPPPAQEGIVNASAADEELTPTTPDWQRKALIRSCRLLPDGRIELPSIKEVARGGLVLATGTVKRNAAGELVEHKVERPRWEKEYPVGPQHLFPKWYNDTTVKVIQNPETPLNNTQLEKLVKLGTKSTEYISEPKKGHKPSGNWYWVDSMREAARKKEQTRAS